MTWQPLARAAALAALCLLPAGLLSAQAEISIRTPEAWDAGRSVSLAEGDTLRVTGTAFHPNGVARVLVNGREAELVRNPQFVNTVNFSAVVTAAAGLTRVSVRIDPERGEAFAREFGLEVRPAPRPVTVLEPEPPAPVGNPWRGMMLRGVGYAAIAGTGIYLGSKTTTDEVEICQPTGAGQDCFRRITETASGRTLGLGLVAGAAVLTAIDLFATSRRASRANAAGRRSDAGGDPGADLRRGPRLVGPALGHQHGRVTALLINVRF